MTSETKSGTTRNAINEYLTDGPGVWMVPEPVRATILAADDAAAFALVKTWGDRFPATIEDAARAEGSA
jgi:hypothetical protein